MLHPSEPIFMKSYDGCEIKEQKINMFRTVSRLFNRAEEIVPDINTLSDSILGHCGHQA